MRVLVACLFFMSPLLAAAQSEDFTIRVFGAEDTEPPSTPVILSVTPLTPDQIDITWSTSTDNFDVFGYVVRRDGVGIATTTLTSFSDTGLTASTTYSYEVLAFDGVPNYSSSSAAVATTTLDIPVTPVAPVEPVQYSTIARVVLDSVRIDAGVTSATMAIEVRQPARIEVRVGETQSYEKGYFVGSVYRRGHKVPVNDLRPNTTYYYEIVGYTPSGMQTILQQGSFTTANDAPPLSPVNVENFTVTVADAVVTARWQLPDSAPDGALVRVVRSHLGFPVAINDGMIVYEGTGVMVRDSGAFMAGDIAYYTAFVIDPNGLVSSGAVALARKTAATSLPGDYGDAAFGSGEGGVTNSTVPTINPVPFDPSMPQPKDIFVTQGVVVYSFASSSIDLRSDELFTVSIPANKIAGAFKTIVATLGDPRGSGKTFSFLLRLNSERTEFTATIAPVQVAGVSELLVDVYDYNAKVVGSYRTQVEFSVARGTGSSTLEIILWRLQALAWGSLLVVPLLTIAGIWFLFRRRQDEDNEPSV